MQYTDSQVGSRAVGYFVFWCVEQYKLAHGLSGAAAANELERYGVLSHLARFHGLLHSLGTERLVEEMDRMVAERKQRADETVPR